MFQRVVISVCFAFLAVPSFARDVLIPVVTGTAGNRTFRTTVVVTNRTNTAAECVFTYRSPGRPDNPLISRETIAAGQARIYEDFFLDVSAAGTIRADCTVGVELVTRLQESSDGGKTFRAGRSFRPFLDDHVIKEGAPGTTRADTDVAIAEVDGKPVHVEVSAANFGGVEYAHAAYDVPSYALRIVSLADVLAKLPATDVTVTVSGKGAIVIGKETREPALANVARRRTDAQRAPQAVAMSAPASSSVIDMLGISPFKGLPFVEPMTREIYMRDRWYNPHTGTFLSPDPMGYADSPNLYTYCGGDPVNCSDPTGLAASMGRSGWIVATDKRHGGRTRRFSPAEITANPQEVRAFLGLNADVDPREADAMIARAGQATALGNQAGIGAVTRGATAASGVYPLMAITAGAGIGGGVGVVASGELGFGFVGSTMLPGFTGGVGGQAGGDISARHFSGVRQYAVSGSVGAVTGLLVGSVFAGGQRLFGTPDVIPSIAPPEGWAPPLPANVARTFTNGQYTSRVLEHDLVGYRGEGGRFGRWLGPVRPSSAADAERMYNVIDYGGDLLEVSEYVIPKGTLIYEGPVAGGTGTQIYVANPRAVSVRLVGTQPLPQYGH